VYTLHAHTRTDGKQEGGNGGTTACRSGDKSARKDIPGEIENLDIQPKIAEKATLVMKSITSRKASGARETWFWVVGTAN